MLRTPLLHPRQYFEQRGFELRPAAIAVGAVVLSLVLAFLGLGVLLSDRLAAAGHLDAAAVVWRTFVGEVFGLVVTTLFDWLVVAGILHLLSRALLSHDGLFGRTLAVAGWGMVPSVFAVVVSFGFLAVAVNDASLASAGAFAEQFRATLQGSSLLVDFLSFLLAGWQTYIYAGGLSVEFRDQSGSAWFVAGVVAYGGWLLGLF